MENASKALIIAGAILISILLITIGIVLINSGRDITETGTAGMTSQKIQTFNAQFSSYEGRKKGSELRGLWNTVNASNASDEVHQVVFGAVNGQANEVNNAGGLVATRNYTVHIEYADAADVTAGLATEVGYICRIAIDDPTLPAAP